jgi:cytochrome c peroxidase
VTHSARIRSAAVAKRLRWAMLPLSLCRIFVMGARAAPDERDSPASVAADILARPFPNDSGALATLSSTGNIDTTGPFFQSLGSNGRSCASCHVAGEAFSVTPEGLRARFRASRGTDPVFAAFDGADCPNAPAGDRARRSLVLNSGLFRIPLSLPATAQFTISIVSDPHGCALAPDPATGLLTVSVYRRPLPSTNLRFLNAVMWDGRETGSPLTNRATVAPNLVADLSHQAIDATLGHAQAAAAPTPAQVAGIVNFELTLSTAQVFDRNAGALYSQGARGGPRTLLSQLYYPGINDVMGLDPTGGAFTPSAFTLFGAWANLADRYDSDIAAARRAIAAGEKLFNAAPLSISNVRGLNDNPALGSPRSFIGTCTTCHDTPNVGNHSLPLPLDIGISHAAMPGMESDPIIADAL